MCGTAFYHVFIDTSVGAACRHDFVKQVDAVSARYHTMFGGFPFDDYTLRSNLYGLDIASGPEALERAAFEASTSATRPIT